MTVIEKRDALLRSLKIQFAQKVKSVEFAPRPGRTEGAGFASLDAFLNDLANGLAGVVHEYDEDED